MSLTFQFLYVYNRNTHHVKFKNIKVTDATGDYGVEGGDNDTPHWHVICCGGPRPNVQPADTHGKKEHSGHPRTLGVKLLGPIAYPLGASRYHVPTEKVKAGEDAADTSQAEDEQTGSVIVLIDNPMDVERKQQEAVAARKANAEKVANAEVVQLKAEEEAAAKAAAAAKKAAADAKKAAAAKADKELADKKAKEAKAMAEEVAAAVGKGGLWV